ncbi:MAG: chemotaxis response regulator protein-glutamate methylesterase [Tindallia sp. MSAO_Bac2]|nr:MAG: chemotaxis response regulator protein-glutamate methylesterase [Tindallia sp. MSAO_Bac2]
MSQKSIKVLVVDDSSFMRKLVSDLLDGNPLFEVIGRARNGKEAIEKAELLKPDVITMDIEMPVMNGLEALEIIVEQYGTSVVMISSLTKEGAFETLKALENGAVDFIEKPTVSFIINGQEFKDELYRKLKIAAEANLKPLLDTKTKKETLHPRKTEAEIYAEKNGIVAIAVSTGGPKALQSVVPEFPEDFPLPILITQHMPPGFTRSLAERLNQTSFIHVKEAVDGEMIKPGTAYIAPGDYHLEAKLQKDSHIIKLHQEKPVNGHRPSADPMFRSLINCNYNVAICVIMTGMGSDGTEGIRDLKNNLKTITIVQDESSCVVFGMPKSAILSGLSDEIVTLNSITQSIINRTGGLKDGN